LKQLVILAGGKGTRLRDRLGNMPKPLIDVCGMPLLERQILLAKSHGFTDVLILVNHAAGSIVDFCAAKDNWGLGVSCIDDGHPRGTAGATLAVFDKLAPKFLVMYGDTMLNVNLTRFECHHDLHPGAAATLFLHPNDHPHDSDLVELNDCDRITGFHSYPHDPARYYPNLVNAALYWVNKQSLTKWRDETRMLDFAKDLFPAMLREGMALYGYCSPEYIKDIGTPTRLDKACADFQSGKIDLASLDGKQAMVFIDRDGTINREVNHLSSPEQLEMLPGVEDAIKKLNLSEYRCCIVTNQPVIARGECTFDDMRQIHNKMETLLGLKGAYLDRIYYCPHHPDKGFPGERSELKVACDCRKPNTGMIDRAIADFNLARDRCWLVGDTSVDIETARRSQIHSILVETGYAGLDYRELANPDFIVPDLAAAVGFILDHYPRLFSYCSGLAANLGESEIVLIGGLARCGKTTFAGVLRNAIQARGGTAVVLSADRWLRSEGARAEGVLGRYDMDALQSLLDVLENPDLRPLTLSLPFYNKLKRERIDSAESVSVAKPDIILIEGTVALALQTRGLVRTHRFHVELDEQLRHQRILNEYQLRGNSEGEAQDIYAARMSDESPIIENLAALAKRISLPESLP
jgi:histidinol-phosphate phosphatase family protein